MADDSAPRFRAAAIWSYGQTIGKLGMSLVLSLVLAAMLGPRAFGVIAMALVFTNFIEMLQQQGMMPAIISHKDMTDRHADTAFWLVLGVSLASTSVGILVAPGWASLNRTPELADVIRVLSLTIPLTATAVVHEALLRRRMAFKQLAIRTWVSVAAGGVAGVTAALLDWGVWALVAQQVVQSLSSTITLWVASHWRPHLRFSGEDARDLWSYTVRSSAASLGVFVGGRVDLILAGLFFGPSSVGLYRMGQRLTAMVVDVTARAMQSVSLPALAKLQDQPPAFEAHLLGMQRSTALLSLPGLAVVYGIAPDVQAVLGPEWTGTSPVIRILVLGQMLVSLIVLIGPALQARQRPGVLAVVLWIWSGTSALAIVIAALLVDDEDIRALSWAVVAGNGTAAVMHVIAAVRVLNVRLSHMVRAWTPGTLAAAAALFTSATLTELIELGHPLADLMISGAAGALASVLCILAVEPRARHLLGRMVHRRRGGAEGTSAG